MFRNLFVRISIALLLTGLSLYAWKYFRAEKITPAAKTDTAPPNQSEEEVDKLRSLGYLNFSEEKDNAGSGVVKNQPASFQGSNFYIVPHLCVAVMMDNNGKIQNVWSGDNNCERWPNVEFLEKTGELLVISKEKPTPQANDDFSQRYLMKLSWNGDVQWKKQAPIHHHVEIGPDGGYIALLMNHRQIPTIDPKLPVRDNSIATFDANGNIKENVSLYDLFSSSSDRIQLLMTRAKKREDLDIFHANSVEWVDVPAMKGKDPLYSPENVLVCVRHQDAVFIMNWRTKKILWAWGQGEISGPHDAHFLPNGHILIFDNGLSRGKSRVVEVDPVTGKIVWEYASKKKPFYTRTRGNSQRLPNGNTIITESDRGRVFEISAANKVVWEFRNPFVNEKGQRGTIERLLRYAPETIDPIIRSQGPGQTTIPEIVHKRNSVQNQSADGY